ncbi:two-component system regulatory protein YycI [Virgibacillus necropolis]|uniref:two-component system regulatory protein YycI n=1 Tax=Virgibacillus necropolis TaxID=163877 RepID=UPI00384B92D2
MQWSQIKTLFILCFLLLDIYLLTQYISKQQETDVESLTEEQESTIQENLKADNIKFNEEELPDKDLEDSYISVQQQQFSEDALKPLKSLESQETVVIDQEFIISRQKDPLPIPEDASDEEIEALVKSKVPLISSDSYVFWDWNKELNVILFFQEKNKRPIYFNQNGIVLLFLNDKNEINFYTQTLLGEVKEQDDSKVLLMKALQSIKVLNQNNELNPGDEISNAEIGYHTRLPLPDGPQVFAPTWKVTVNDERNYFVNAIEGYIFSSDDVEFLNKAIQEIIAKVGTIEGNKDLKQYFVNLLSKRLEVINRSELE